VRLPGATGIYSGQEYITGCHRLPYTATAISNAFSYDHTATVYTGSSGEEKTQQGENIATEYIVPGGKEERVNIE
jgi:hypothetical protein